jgi:predicted SnoaL-like aldol condensation-catalyzing enzyme
MLPDKKDRTAAIQKSLETRVRHPISWFDSRKYIQHNLGLADGLAPILELMDSLPADNTKVNVLLSMEDGDHSFAIIDYVLGDWGPMVGFEIHRWEDDRIVEHWDNLQSTPMSPNASGHTLTDGDLTVKDHHLTVANKSLAAAFTQKILINRDHAAAPTFFENGNLIQHSPEIGDGEAVLLAYLGKTNRTYSTIRKTLGEGNMALIVTEGMVGDKSAAFYDLYRVSDGKLAEHWEVVEIIPPRETWQNDNGKF